MVDNATSNPQSLNRRTDFISAWISVIVAFIAYYLFLAGFTAMLFAIALHVIFDGGDPRVPCPFDDLPLTNCHSLCAGPPQLMSTWSAAAVGSLEREHAGLAITEWIAGRNNFVWDSLAVNDTASTFDGFVVTNDFYRKIGCCKLLDGTPLTRENVDNRTLWDDVFNNDATTATGPTCSTFTGGGAL
jgi:hypothetical protein